MRRDALFRQQAAARRRSGFERWRLAWLFCLLLIGAGASSAHNDGGREGRDLSRAGEDRASRVQRDDSREARNSSRSESRTTDRKSGHDEDSGGDGGRGSSREPSGSSGHGSEGSADDSREGKDAGEGDEGLRRDSNMHVASERIRVERDHEGRERRAGEVLVLARASELAAIRAAGYAVIGESPLNLASGTIARVRVPPQQTVEQGIERITLLAPDASASANFLYRLSAATGEAAPPARPGAESRAMPGIGAGSLLGLIDAGADSRWAAISNSIVRTRGFAPGGYAPRTHGTVVAEIASASGAQLMVADVFGTDADDRLVAPAEAIAAAVDWLSVQGVAVVNMSIEGPDSPVLARVIHHAQAKGMLIVAAAGNGGPAAPAPYPAAYPGVIAVTAVDDGGNVYRRANRGDYIHFAARGVRVQSRYGSEAPRTLSGTSFASPVVAAALCRQLAMQGSPDTATALAALEASAIDLGARGRDPIFGFGEIR